MQVSTFRNVFTIEINSACEPRMIKNAIKKLKSKQHNNQQKQVKLIRLTRVV